MNTKFFKEKTIVDYEIDKKKLKHFYCMKDRKKNPYTIIQKKILFSKENCINSKDKRKQYSDYLTFRYLTTSGYEKEEMKNEIASGLTMLKYSQSLRKELMTTLNIQKLLISLNTSSEPNTIQQSNTNSNIKLIQSKLKKAINTVKITDEVFKKCHLLKYKSQQDNIDLYKTEFKLYCHLEQQCFESSMTQISKLNLHFFNQKEKILRAYNREKVLLDYIKQCNDEDKVKITVDNMNQEIKDQFSMEIIYSIYHPRENGFYYKYDSFMEYYTITPAKVKNNERDLYDHIYSILFKCNYSNFLSFLYSKNNLFKFIYNEFSDKDAGGDYTNIYEQIEESFQQEKEKDKDKDKEKQALQNSDQLKIQDMHQIFNHEKNNKQNSILLDEMLGSNICLQIGIVPDAINEESLNKFKNKIVESNRNDNFLNKVIQCQNLEFDSIFIMKNEIIKIYNPKLNESQEDLGENNIIRKIKPKNNFNFEIEVIETTIIEINNEDIPDEELLSVNNQVFYLIKEIIDEINYYLFKIKYEFKKIFESVIDKAKIKKTLFKDLNKSISDDGGTIEFVEIQNQLKNLKNIKQTEESPKDDSSDDTNQLFDLKDKLFPKISSQGHKEKTDQQSFNQSKQSDSMNEIKAIAIESTTEKYKPVGILK